jgi:phage repressor protein C with HTH and peptisase S24 domain
MARKAISKTPIGQRLSAVREALKYPSRAALAAELEMNPETLGGYERGDSNPDLDLLGLYSQRFSVNLNWVLTGEGDMFASASVPNVVADTVNIPFYDLKASAGHGLAILENETAGSIGISERFLRELGLIPANVLILQSSGESMYPTITDGSVLIVDRSATYPSTEKVYVLSIAGDLFVKRVRREIDSALTLLSDNDGPQYAPMRIAPEDLEHLRIVGRVVYVLCPV